MTKRQTPRKHAAQPKPPHAIAVRSKVDATKFAIIAVGASAGGLEAFTKLLEAFPPQSGVAIILVQHLDPTHKSLMASLLAPHTQMPVLEVITGTQIKPNTVYIIEPGTYLAIHNDILEVTTPRERHGARMPFDFLLQSLAEDCGERSVGVILSGNGKDGSIGLRAINKHGGLVIAQDPNEATHNRMPQSAIDTGLVHLILPIEKIPPSLARYVQQMNALEDQDRLSSPSAESVLHEIKAILQSCAGQDFAAYKSGTLMRRIARRMASQAIDDINVYLAFLRADEKEANILAKELLIHVTAFFRDTAVFELLAATVIPELVRQHEMDKPIRIWVPACSSGEEVYSLAMMFLEAITAAKKSIKLQIFGTDIDEQAVTTARAGRYPASLKAELSSERLARFFVEDGGGYRIGPSLRETVIFTVHDILVDPPFARVDFVSCRNLLIYLLPEAQQRVLSLLHFALRKGGVLLLGIAENIGSMRGDFDPVSDDLRIFRRAGGGYKFKALLGFNSQPRAFWPRTAQTEPQRTADLGDISRRALLDSYAPASVLIDQKDQGLYYFGSTDKYLQIPSGDASHSIHTMARPSVRHKLRAAIRRARSEKKFIAVSDGISERSGISSPLIIEVRPVENPDRELFLVSFIDAPQPVGDPHSAGPAEDVSKISALEARIEGIKKELQDTIQELETSSADQEAINEEAQSLNEEFQSTNEELETSKEELQSLNEELTALNGQLSATVNQQRNTADDLENILRSSELAIIFLDGDLNIRFFSAAAKSLLNAIDSDIGRQIEDLAYRFDDPDLLPDIGLVLKTMTAISRDIRAHNGDWYTRQALPYRTRTAVTRGVILTFNNVTLAKAAELRIETARTYADNIINTVRQPLVVIDARMRVVSSNVSFRRMLAVEAENIAGQDFLAVGGGRLNTPAVNIFLDRARAETSPIQDFEVEVDLASEQRCVLLLSSYRMPNATDAQDRILLAIDDVTERKQVSAALEIAKLKAETANIGKSRFLAAASHDLRQPLQTLSLLHGILARKIADPESLGLIRKLNETLGAMAGMLDTLLDINQLEAGKVQPEISTFKIIDVLEALRTEFTHVTKSKGISLRVAPCSLSVRSDPLLLAQMLRNLLSNAVKYTKQGKILLGCRRAGNQARIEVWDTGIGIPTSQLKAIFEEYYQLGNPARERGLGLGLGLSIVNRIGDLLGHRTTVRSEAGKGSVFMIDLPLDNESREAQELDRREADKQSPNTDKSPGANGVLLIVEDDPAVRDALELLLRGEGYRTIAATDGIEVAALAQRGALMPDLVIADYNLPGGRTGLEVIVELRQTLSRKIPGIILTGDIATDVLRRAINAECEYLHKPVDIDQLLRRIADAVATSKQPYRRTPRRKPARSADNEETPVIYIVDDDTSLLESMRDMLQNRGHSIEIHASAESFLSSFNPDRRGCLVVDSVMPGISGLELLRRLNSDDHDLPAIMITGHGDVAMAISAMKAGAMDFIEKPAREEDLLSSIDRALIRAADSTKRSNAQRAAAASIAELTPREREVLDYVVQGLSNKQIAFNLDISQRTVETHRAAVMNRTGADSLPDLIRLVMQAG